jgi:hypothetical protein
MPEPTTGPELDTLPDGALHTPETASQLERAASALEGVASTIQGLMTNLTKDQDPPADPPAPVAPAAPVAPEENPATVEKGKLATALREVSERAASLAGAKDMAPGKMMSEVKALITLLQGAMEKYPAPAAKSEDGIKVLGEVSEAFAAIAKEIGDDLTDETVSKVDAAVGKLDELATSLEIAKKDAQLPEIFSVEEPAKADLAKGFINLLQSASARMALVAKMVGDEFNDAAKDEIGGIRDQVIEAKKSIPTWTTKASKGLVETLKGVAARAVTLVDKAKDVNFEDARALREVGNIQQLLGTLAGKYADVKKDSSFELSDLGQILSADRLLSQFEAELERLNLTPAPTPTEPPAPVAKTDPPPADPDPPAVDPEPEVPAVAELQGKLAALAGQVTELQATIAKARGPVEPPASDGGDPPSTNVDETLLFPINYNDPAYREKLKERGIKD